MVATTPATLADPWSRAKATFLHELEPSERKLFDNATLENIYSTTNNVNLQDAEGSKTRNVIQKLGPLVSAIQNYGSALDTLAQIAPLYLSPIWGSIRVVLATARSHAKFYDRIVDTLSRIGDILPRFRDYERIYDCEKYQGLADALSNTYLEIIIICTEFRKCLRDYQASSFRRILKPLSLNQRIEDALERFRRHKHNVGEEAGHCHMIEAAEQRNKELVLAAAEKRRKLLSRLSSVNCQHRHRRLRESRHEGTGVWLAALPEYHQWEELEKSSVLCCYGIPGCGKSVLASSIVDSLEKTRTTALYYCDYADKGTLDPSNMFGTLARQLLENIDPVPKDLALQIEQAPQERDRISNSEDAIKFLLKAISLQNQPVFIIFDGLDEASEESQKTVYWGLREVLNTSLISVKLLITGREEVASRLKLSPTFCYRKISMSSTHIMHDIEQYVRASTKRRISDGSLVIQDPTLEKQIVEKLVTGAEGMFLWVEFQLNDLCRAESDHGIKAVLQNLPRNLSETYKRLLERIEGPERKTMILRLFKWIVCARKPMRVDELREGVAFTLYDEEWVQDKIPTDFKRLVRACSNLVIVDEETQVVKLAHYTVQQYLLKPNGTGFSFTLKEANVMAGQICIAYLNFSNFNTQMIEYKDNATTQLVSIGKLASHGQLISHDNPAYVAVHAWNAWRSQPSISKNLDISKLGLRRQAKISDFSHFTLLEYVKSHWFWHARDFQHQIKNELQQDTLRQLQLFYELTFNRNLLFEFRPWDEGHNEGTAITPRQIFEWALNSNHSYLVYVLSGKRRIDTTRMILTDWDMLLQKYEITSRPWKLPRRLLDDIDLLMDDLSSTEPSKPGWLCSRIVSASRKGWLDLIHASASYDGVEFTNDFTSYLLLEAAAYGALPVVISLSKMVENPWALRVGYGNQFLNSLEVALLAGHLEVVKYLWETGFRIQNMTPSVDSFLQILAVQVDTGNLDALEALFYVRNRGIWFHDLLLEGFQVKDLVINAVELGNTHVVEILLKHLTDSTCRHMFYDALASAIKFSHLEIIDSLLRHFYTRPDDYCMPLTLAACSGNLDIIDLVLKYNPNAARNEHRSIMLTEEVGQVKSNQQEAHRNDSIVPLSRPELNCTLSSTHIPLSQPEKNGSFSNIYLCPTPLYMACYFQHLPVVKALIQYGASLSSPSPQTLTLVEVFTNIYGASWFKLVSPTPSSKPSIIGRNDFLYSYLEGSSFTSLDDYDYDSDHLAWETPLGLMSRRWEGQMSLGGSHLGEELSSFHIEDFKPIKLPVELSLAANLLAQDGFRNFDYETKAPIFDDLVRQGRNRLTPGHYGQWAQWFCLVLDHNDKSLQTAIIDLTPNLRVLLYIIMARTIQEHNCRRIQRLRDLSKENLPPNFHFYHTIPSFVNVAQSRKGPTSDVLRDILISEGAIVAFEDEKHVVQQVVKSCVTYSRLNYLSVDDYIRIIQEARVYSLPDRNSDARETLVGKLFNILAFPSPGSVPLKDAYDLAEQYKAVGMKRIIRKFIAGPGLSHNRLSDFRISDIHSSTTILAADGVASNVLEIEEISQPLTTIPEEGETD